jgi:hypothetical protein
MVSVGRGKVAWVEGLRLFADEIFDLGVIIGGRPKDAGRSFATWPDRFSRREHVLGLRMEAS